MLGIIMYGPPASGKDTVTDALLTLDGRYQRYARMKVGPGRTAGYRMATQGTVEALRADEAVIWENHRYNATYVVDHPTLSGMLDDQVVPVVHLGQREAVEAVAAAVPNARWLVTYLWCPRDVAAERITARQTGDTAARLRAWDTTEALPDADLMIDTAAVEPAEAARKIHTAAMAMVSRR